jgi:RNA polymerase sigma-70 factor (ECF subfamily)
MRTLAGPPAAPPPRAAAAGESANREQTTVAASGRGDERAALTAAMDRHADGDGPAFEEVYDLLAPRLTAFFLRRTRARASAEDLTQQTLLQMHRARQSFARGSDVVPWAFAIARHLFIDSRRRKGEVRFASAEEEEAHATERISGEGVPEEIAAAKQMAARADAELERLPEPQRAAYRLVREEGLSVAQAAEVLATTPAAVKQRLFRAYESLRAALGIDDPEALS